MTPETGTLATIEPEVLVANISAEGQPVFRNEAWIGVLGYDANPWDRLSDSDRQQAMHGIAEAYSGSLVTGQVFLVSLPHRDEPLPVLLHFLPVYTGEPAHVAAVTVTGEVLAEPSTWIMSQTHRHRMESLGRMTMGIAHDLNNLLSGILGHTELMKTAGVAPSLAEHVRTIEQAALDGASLVRKIQQYIRREKKTSFELLDLPTLIQDCVALTRPYWFNEPRRQGIVIDTKLEMAEVPPISGSATELREVFVNLILNAVQAMPNGGGITINVRYDRARGVIVRVSDTGVGMSDAVRAHIFEPLFTTKGEHGTGMGLAVTYGILQSHDATISVESRLGSGTDFEMVFPTSSETTDGTKVAEPEELNVTLRILVVDDDPMVRSVLARLLSVKGHEVTQASSGAEGLDLLRSNRYEVVFTDHGMPEMNGRQFARIVRAEFPDLPIVLLTGDTDAGNVDETIDRVVAKPFKLDQLQGIIGELIASR